MNPINITQWQPSRSEKKKDILYRNKYYFTTEINSTCVSNAMMTFFFAGAAQQALLNILVVLLVPNLRARFISVTLTSSSKQCQPYEI